MIIDSQKSIVFDTSVLVSNPKCISKIIDLYKVIIPIVVIEELDNLKTSKDGNTSYSARQAIKEIEKYRDNITFDLDKSLNEVFIKKNLETKEYNNNDNIILSSAKRNNSYLSTNDLNLKIKSNFLNVQNIEISLEEENYTGYKEINMSEEEMAEFYSKPEKNKYELFVNQYILIKNEQDEIVDRMKWNRERFVNLYNKPLRTIAFGDKIKAKDDYQRMVIDSIMTNTITSITGKAGSGKSLLSLVCALNLIETGKYDTLVILFNPTKTREASDLGFYTGSATEKAMQNSIGNILTSKFGDRYAVDMMLNSNPPKIKLVSMADIRGFEIRDREILYISECQNTSSSLLKLCLSRASEGAKIIIEGDFKSQVDSYSFEGENNGLKRAIETFKNEEIYGHIELKNIWRSKIASIVDKM